MALYKKTLIIGATSGIGEALAIKLASTGTAVIATGRRKDRLEALGAKVPAGAAAITTMVQDVIDLASIPAFAAEIAAAHPDLDSVVFNSGIQRAFDFGQPSTVDLAALGIELTTNYLACVYLVTALLPQLQERVREGRTADLVFISATLGLVPSLVRTPNYNASKAALHSFITTLRQQQIDAGFAQLHIVEVYPPAVQTELHDTKHQPDLVGGDKLGMPLDAFTEELFAKLQARPTLHVGIGIVEGLLAEGGLEDQRQKLFEQQQVHVKAALSQFTKKARPRRAPDDNGRRIVGPQSALTNYLASHNISARQIEQDFQERRAEALRRAAEEEEQRRQENGEPRADGFGTPSLNATPRRASVRIAGTVGATTASAIEPETTVTVEVGASGGGDQLSAREVLDQIKQKKKGRKKKKRRVDSDDEEEDTLLALGVAAAAALPGQMDNCASCGKRFTVTPYSRADTTGRLLCTTCSKKQDEEEAAARGNKGAKRARGGGRGGRGGAVGQRRKAQSRILDGASPVGAKTLVTLCVEHLSRNIHLADDLGDLPEVMLDRIGRMLAKRRLLNTRTLQLFMRPEAEAVSVYDGALLGMDDYIGMLQAMPRLRRVVVHNAIQFRDDVMRYLMERDVRLETLSLYGANLLSEGMWSEFLRTRGVWLRTLQVCYTDKHITDLVLQCVRDYAPGLQRLKINGNQALGPAGVGAIGGLPVLQHLGLDLSSPVRADVLVRLITDVGGRLQTLSLRRVTGADNTVLAALHDHCRSLRKLRLTENCRFTDAGFVRLFEGWANEPLRFVDFERCRHDDPDQPRDNSDLIGLCSDGFRALMAHSGAALRHLNLCACRHIEHEAFEDVFAADKVYPELTHIEVSFCEEITDGIVCSMFRCCPNLRDVVTFGCMRVTGVQVPYGRIVVGVPNALGMQIFGQDDE